MKSSVYYKSDSTTLYHGDSFMVLDELIDKKQRYDLIFSDPPYFLSNGGMSVHGGKRVKVNKGEWDSSQGLDADFKFTYNWIEKCRTLLTDDGAIWISGTLHNIYMVGYVLQKLGFVILNDIGWFKPNAPPHLACRYFAHAHETLLWAKKSKKAKHVFHYNIMKKWDHTKDFVKNINKQMRSIWAIPLTHPKEKLFGKHPTQKPEALLERIIVATSNEKASILDPFCGSGTTGVVARRYNRNFVGIEKDKSFLDIAVKRLQAGVMQEEQNPLPFAENNSLKPLSEAVPTAFNA